MKPWVRTVASISLVSLLLVYLAILITMLVTNNHTISLTNGNMEPALAEGSLLFINKTEPDKLQIGDIIAFKSQDDSTKVSRVVGFIESDSLLFFRTKADAKVSLDLAFVDEADIEGTIGFRIPYLGSMMNYSASLAGKLVLLTPVLVMLGVLLMLNRHKISRSASNNKM
ncbi:MAG: signal peptidase I [Dehalococcoidales bacterium]|nr:signal peptidase I [Dehalococcoidales bacterium]